MTTVTLNNDIALSTHRSSPGQWTLAWRRLIADRIAMVSMTVVAAFLLLTVASSLGLVAGGWSEEVAIGYAPPTFAAADTPAKAKQSEAKTDVTANAYPGSVVDPLAAEIAELKSQLGQGAKVGAGGTAAGTSLIPGKPMSAAEADKILAELGLSDIKVFDPLEKEMAEILAASENAAEKERVNTLTFGADKWGHDVLLKVIKGSETSIFVGLAAALVATLIGTLTGAFAGYYGGWIDDLFNWFYSIFTAIPYLLLILAIAAVLNQKGVTTIVLILGLTGWTGIFRLVRAEYMKHRTREYVQAADAIGASNMRRMFVHIFPNISHVSLVQLSVHAVGFIKSEVILSFLGFGVPVDKVSWGSMLGEAQNELILGYWWQLAAATIAMAILVTAFSMFTDALRDALDPKIK
jgi:peptide/nickel transport system permease protein